MKVIVRCSTNQVLAVNEQVSRRSVTFVTFSPVVQRFSSLRPVDPKNIREGQEELVFCTFDTALQYNQSICTCMRYICLLATARKTKFTGITSGQSEKA